MATNTGLGSDSPTTEIALRAEISFPPGERFVSGFSHGLAVSPDGKLLAFTSGTVEPKDLAGRSAHLPETSQLYLRRLGQQASYPVPGTKGAKNPVFSPDSQWIAFQVLGPGGGFPLLKKVPVGGGDAVELCPCAVDYGMTWGPPGIVFPHPYGFRIVPPEGGDQKQLKFDFEPEEYKTILPSFLPDGQTLLITVLRFKNYQSHDWGAARVYAYSFETGQRKLLLEGASDARYMSSGHLLFARHFRPLSRFDDKVVWAVPFDPSSLTIKGPEVPVLGGVNHFVDTGKSQWERGASQYSVSEDGLLAYVPGSSYPWPRRDVVWVDREGREEKVPIDLLPYAWARIGTRRSSILLSTNMFPGQIYLFESGQRMHRRFAPQAPGAPRQSESMAVWGPGSNQITFLLDSYDKENRRPTEIWTSEIDSPETATRLSIPKDANFGGFRAAPLEWSPDGKHAAMFGLLWSLDSQGELKQPATSPSIPGGSPSFSPDGKWVAYVRARRPSSILEVHVRSTFEAGPPLQSLEGASPVWSRDGKELFFMRQEPPPPEKPDLGSSAVYSVSIREVPDGLRLGDPKKLFQGRYLDGTEMRTYDVGPDGRFLMIKELDSEQQQKIIEEFYPQKIQLVQNWFSELNRLAPTGQ